MTPTPPNPRPDEEHEQDIERRTMPIEKMVAMMLRVYGREAWEQAWDAHMAAEWVDRQINGPLTPEEMAGWDAYYHSGPLPPTTPNA